MVSFKFSDKILESGQSDQQRKYDSLKSNLIEIIAVATRLGRRGGDNKLNCRILAFLGGGSCNNVDILDILFVNEEGSFG